MLNESTSAPRAAPTVRQRGTTNAVAGHRHRGTSRRDDVGNSARGPARPTTLARNPATNAIAAPASSAASTGAAVSTVMETMVPLVGVRHFGPGNTPLAVNHQGMFVASTISFNLPPGTSLSDATRAIYADDDAASACRPRFTAVSRARPQAFQQSPNNEPLLIAAALARVYIVLGILYESYIHPITILSTLPSAGIGAVLALMLFNTEFSIIALIGVILLIGIVKKNAIMMIDFALAGRAQRGPEHARRHPSGLPAALPPDHDDDLRRVARARCRWRSARARAPSCASRSASPSSAACWSARC